MTSPVFVGFSDYDADGVLNTWFNGAPSVAPSNYWIGLLSVFPTDGSGDGLSEPWVPAPTIDTITSVSTGGFINGNTTRYYVVTEVNPSGETTGSVEVSYLVPAGTNTNVVTVSWTGSGTVGNTFNVYQASTSGAEVLIATGITTTYYNDTGSGYSSGLTFTGRPGQVADDGYYTAATSGNGTVLGNFSGDSVYNFIRIPNVAIPKGALVTSATLSLYYLAHGGSGTIDVTILGDKEANPAEIVSLADLEGRPTTVATEAWSPANSWSGYASSPSFASVLTELFAQSGWVAGNAIQLFIEDDGSPASTWVAAYGYLTEPPSLSVTYTPVPPTTNTTGNGYQRVKVAVNPTNFPFSNGRQIANGITVAYAAPTSAWPTIIGWAAFDGPNTNARFRMCGGLLVPVTVPVGTPPQFAPGTLITSVGTATGWVPM